MNSQEIMTVLDELGKRMAGPAEQVWEVYIKQIMMYGIADIAVGVVLIALVLTLIRWAYKVGEEAEEADIVFYASFLSSAVCLFSACLFVRGIMFLYNPAYYVIRDLAQMIR